MKSKRIIEVVVRRLHGSDAIGTSVLGCLPRRPCHFACDHWTWTTGGVGVVVMLDREAHWWADDNKASGIWEKPPLLSSDSCSRQLLPILAVPSGVGYIGMEIWTLSGIPHRALLNRLPCCVCRPIDSWHTAICKWPADACTTLATTQRKHLIHNCLDCRYTRSSSLSL